VFYSIFNFNSAKIFLIIKIPFSFPKYNSKTIFCLF